MGLAKSPIKTGKIRTGKTPSKSQYQDYGSYMSYLTWRVRTRTADFAIINLLNMFLKRVLALITIVFSSSLFIPQIALASCAPPVSLAEYKEQAAIVVLGRVEKVNDKAAIVVVERYFKGHGGLSQIQVTGKESDGAVTSVDFSIEEGKRYLLFLQKLSGSSTLKTNACMGNKEITDDLSAEDRAMLGKGYSPNGSTQELSKTESDKQTAESVNMNVLLPIVGGAFGLGVVVFALNKHKRKSSK